MVEIFSFYGLNFDLELDVVGNRKMLNPCFVLHLYKGSNSLY